MSNKFLSKMLYALTSAYSRKDYDNVQLGLPLETNIGKLFSILAWGLETVEEQAKLVRLWDDLDYACGSVLDRYGANFGVKRVSSDDRFYRLAIKVKIMAQLSGGDTDTVIRAAAMLLDVEQSDVLLEDVFPAKIALYVDTSLLSPDREELIEPIAYAIKRILVAGVGMRLYLRTYRTYRYDLDLGCAAGSWTRTCLPCRWAKTEKAQMCWASTLAGIWGQSSRLLRSVLIGPPRCPSSSRVEPFRRLP